ncbi:MAG: hypothetical protein ACRDY7_00950 [Acidimicrobiia bacterium]
MVCLLAVAACGDDGETAEGRTSATERSTSTTVAAPAPETTSTSTGPSTERPGSTPAVPTQFAEFLEDSDSGEVLARHGLDADPLADLFRRLCDEFRAGVPVEELFVKYSDEVARRSATEGDELRAAFADVFGAGVPALCPEATPRSDGRPPGP